MLQTLDSRSQIRRRHRRCSNSSRRRREMMNREDPHGVTSTFSTLQLGATATAIPWLPILMQTHMYRQAAELITIMRRAQKTVPSFKISSDKPTHLGTHSGTHLVVGINEVRQVRTERATLLQTRLADIRLTSETSAGI